MGQKPRKSDDHFRRKNREKVQNWRIRHRAELAVAALALPRAAGGGSKPGQYSYDLWRDSEGKRQGCVFRAGSTPGGLKTAFTGPQIGIPQVLNVNLSKALASAIVAEWVSGGFADCAG
jgi:hypothetical protein